MNPKNSVKVTEKADPSQNVDITYHEIASQAESRLRLRIDCFVVPTITFLYLMCFIDRTNIGEFRVIHCDMYSADESVGNTCLAGFEKDLALKGYDYNTVLSVFYISYIIFEIPATLCCKPIGTHTPLHAECDMCLLLVRSWLVSASYNIRFWRGLDCNRVREDAGASMCGALHPWYLRSGCYARLVI
jgi:hypothetical protein